jgi:hypothetical protein
MPPTNILLNQRRPEYSEARFKSFALLSDG